MNTIKDIGEGYFKKSGSSEHVYTRAELLPQYTITRVSAEHFHLYDAAAHAGTLLTIQGATKALANIQGCSLSKEEISAITKLDTFGSILIPQASVPVAIAASVSPTMSVVPWKLVEINGTAYFIKEDINTKLNDETIVATASAHPTVKKYLATITARSVSEAGLIIKACDCCNCSECSDKEPRLSMHVNFDTQRPEVISVDIDFTGTVEELREHLSKILHESEAFLPKDAIDIKDVSEQPEVVEFYLTSPEAPDNKVAIASSVDTLKVYAQAHYKEYKITDKNLKVVACSTPEARPGAKAVFTKNLDALLEQNYAKAHNVLVKDESGDTKVVDKDDTQAEDVSVDVGGKHYSEVKE